ncbi:right-handed parallel beta-helix repeat-containing protein [Bradyrhizobium australiense]|nr:right-handed parallel beta-helix repeat-containing protein [Bradyrhizobium australiense]
MICRDRPNDAFWRWVDDGQHPGRPLCRALMQAAICLVMVWILLAVALQVVATAAAQGVTKAPCPRDAIAVEPGASIQAAVDRADPGATLCVKNGMHRMQAIRPKPGQSFHGEGQTVLNGSRLLTNFSREEGYWVASGQAQLGQKHGECANAVPACSLPEGLFIDDQPLVQVLTKESVEPGRFYFDHAGSRIYFADDPTGRKVEATVAAFAFESRVSNVVIRNVTIEKYASVAQKGAIQAQEAVEWIVENCEVRLNSGAGIAVGTSSRVRDSNVHHNGQIGITGAGRDVLIEGNQVWANNIRGFSSGWEAGGVKIALGDGVVFRGNHIHGNFGPGLWCDINCRNVLYENNVVERNHGAGIFHEISFSAVIRNNIVRHNGIADKGWFWGNDILIAASQDVEVDGNTLTVSPGKCGIMLIDQGRDDQARTNSGPIYKTRNNAVHDNEITFEGAACAGGASDVKPGHENFSIITDGHNLFDSNVYHVPRASGPARFVWGHATFDWDGLRGQGVEPNGHLVIY